MDACPNLVEIADALPDKARKALPQQATGGRMRGGVCVSAGQVPTRMPVDDLLNNRAYMVTTTLAWNLKA